MRLTLPSPVTRHRFSGIDFYLKRDDLIDRDFSGNKARKFLWLLEQEMPGIKRVVSYGSAQSNAMYSLSLLAKMRGWKFHYYVDHIPKYLREHPHGNYLAALQNGMILHEGEALQKTDDADTLFIEEGGRDMRSEYGIAGLARELHEVFGKVPMQIFLPSGTGTTALFLQKHLPWRVLTTPCVGDARYLKQQFFELESDERLHPTILETARKYHFGKLYRDFVKIWIELKKETKVTFDLLYDPKGWLAILENRDIFEGSLCYIHQGGLLGNESMIRRYERKFHEVFKYADK